MDAPPKFVKKQRKPMTEQTAFLHTATTWMLSIMAFAMIGASLGIRYGVATISDVFTAGVIFGLAAALIAYPIPKGFRIAAKFSNTTLAVPPQTATRKMDTQAVSPIIAVILMVAITVVLAATVFVLVSDIGGQSTNTAPQVAWSPDEIQDRLSVNTATQNADWARLNLTSNGLNVRYALNNEATSTSQKLPYMATANPARIQAGDYLSFCANVAQSNVEIIVRDSTANAVILRHTFTSLAAC